MGLRYRNLNPTEAAEKGSSASLRSTDFASTYKSTPPLIDLRRPRIESLFNRAQKTLRKIVKQLLGLLVISGAVTAALFFLTSLARTGGNQATQAITLKDLK